MTDTSGPIRVLYVDDEPNVAEAVAESLEGEDEQFTVETATSANDGLSRFADTEFDCIVSEYRLSGRDGIEFLHAIREDRSDLPFILYTSGGSEAVASRAISAGVTDYLRKGSDTDRYELLTNRIHGAVEEYRARRDTEHRKRRLRTIVDHLPHLLYAVDADGTLVLANETYADFHDTTVDEVEGASVTDVLDGATYERFHADVRDVLESGEPKRIDEIEMTDRSGETRVFDPRLIPYDAADADDRGVLGIAIDVTEREERERQLEQYETVVETIPEGVFILDPEGRIVFETETGAEMMGAEPGQFRGEPFSRFVEAGIVDDEIIETYIDNVREMLSSETDRDHAQFTYSVTVDGEERIYEAHLALRPFEDEFRGTVGVFRDVTERERNRRELERKNDRLDEFASFVSHDLRNPLNVAKGRLALAREEGDGEHLDIAATALERMELLIDDLLTLARQGDRVDDFESVRLADVLEECWRHVETKEATLVTDTERTIRADPPRLRELLENLIRNAVEHGGEDVTVTIGDLDDGFYVADDGPGIPEEEREEVFESGYSTTEEGTGFGLQIVEQIAEAHEWTIALTESDQGGARFEFTDVGTSQ